MNKNDYNIEASPDEKEVKKAGESIADTSQTTKKEPLAELATLENIPLNVAWSKRVETPETKEIEYSLAA